MDPSEGQTDDGVRRSSRVNIGQPPSRYGEWTQGLGTSILTSTRLTTTGTPMTRRTLVAPPNAVVSRRAEDNIPLSSSGADGPEVDLIGEEIERLERSVNSKLDLLKSLREIQKVSEDPNVSDIDLDEETNREAGFVDNQQGASYGAPPAGLYVPTPHTTAAGRNSIRGPVALPSADVHREPPRTRLFQGVGHRAANPPSNLGATSGFGGNFGPYGAANHGDARAATRPYVDPGLSSNLPFSGAAGGGQNGGYPGLFGGAYPQQNPQALGGVDALAAAMIQALQIQSKNTERFVARQSHSSALPIFSGNPLDWPIFAHHYIQSTADCGFTPAQNMTRLEKALRGDARKAVRSLMIIPNNANEVMYVLEQRFGRAEIVILALQDLARKAPTPKESKLSTLVDYSIAVRNLVTTIRTLNQPSYLENPSLLQELVDKLPDQFKFQWGMHVVSLGRRANLEDFAWWMNQAAEAASRVTIPKYSLKERWDDKKEERTFAASDDHVPEPKVGQQSKDNAATRMCVACDKEGHGLGGCPVFLKMPVTERWDLAKKRNRCFRCLRGGHSLGSCKSKAICRVDGCNRRHHTLLHGTGPAPAKDPSKEKEEKVDEINASVDSSKGSSLLKIAVVTLYGPAGKVTANALLDEGSTVTLMSTRVAEKLGLEGVTDPLRIRWTNGTTQTDSSSMKVDCWIGPYGEKEKFKIRKVRTVKDLALPAQRTDLKEIVKLHPHLQNTKMKYLPGKRPEILIGQPHNHLTVARDLVEKDEESPLISKTKLGWVMHGPSNDDGGIEATFSCHHETDDDILHNLVKESFALESIGIKTTVSTRSKEDVAAEEMMDKLTVRVGDRWQTGLLWRKEPIVLPPSRDVAFRRYLSTERKLKRNPEIARQYNDKIQHYLDAGYARKLSPEELKQPSDVEWHLPHFDRMHPNKPGKIRIVFDAASRSNGVSLNDYLLTGPDLLVSLLGILLKFRGRRIAISGDIAEMFHQVRIQPKDCPAQRFIWKHHDDTEPSTYQLEVMMFGSVCSPFCAQYVKNRNAKEFENEYPVAVSAIIYKHYMDDYLDSMDSDVDAVNLANEVTEVHRRGGFVIGKWTSNSKMVLKELTGEISAAETKDLAEWSEVPTERALGLHWIPEEDKFTFRVNLDRAGDGIATGRVVPTKRAVLRLVMLVWDPLGFLGHYIIKARILLQDLWRTKLGWDDQLTDRQFKKWKLWIEDLPKLTTVRIPRCYSAEASSSANVTLHIFADSSEAASCAVAYLRTVEGDGNVKVTMIMAKTRVAPVKPCSVPRLELTAALIASRMGKFIQSELGLKLHGVTYWTDSMTTLRWIRAEARRFQQFVAVRVGEIQENTEITQWRWVPTGENPADDGTRDGRADLGPNSRWWNGPAFLKESKEYFPAEPGVHGVEAEGDLMELRKEFVAVAVELPVYHLPAVDRISKYLILLRSTAYVLKYMEALLTRGKPSRMLDIGKAQQLLWRRSQWESYSQDMFKLSNGQDVAVSSPLYQLSPMLDESGVLRMRSRIATAERRSLRCPVILHPKEKLTRLLITHYHIIFGHAGEDLVINELRQKFWIPHIRSSVRKICRECVTCRKKRIQSKPPMMGDIPEFKLQPQPRAFNICGMDYFGPMDVTVGRRREKRYGVLFTCMNTRAVHLEVAHSLTTDSCIMAIRRLISRRGQPTQMYSDNGTNLRGADKELRLALKEINQDKMSSELSTLGMEWHFIPPAAAHMGGSWERLVRSVKTAMWTILKCRAPRDEVLLTVFAEAEAIVNSRPLTEVPVDPGSQEALTPFHFLIGTSSTLKPPGVFSEDNVDLQKHWRRSQALANMFWRRWVREYIPTLQRRAKWHKGQPPVEVGDIVVVLDESLKRNTWPMGIITVIFPGKDGVTRVAEVRTAHGVYRRPVVKLGKLDVRKEVQE